MSVLVVRLETSRINAMLTISKVDILEIAKTIDIVILTMQMCLKSLRTALEFATTLQILVLFLTS